jgi:ATPase subunit of ABC transporter with duplicated ATPase domains
VYHSCVIRRLYVNNFRCLQNFDLPIAGLPSALLIGRNGAGKSTVGSALEILQKIARGTNRVGELVRPKDCNQNQIDVPMRFEIEVELHKNVYHYALAFEVQAGNREMRVLEEKLLFDSKPIYTRDFAQVTLSRQGKVNPEAKFLIDWHLIALPIVQQQSPKDPLFIFKQWLAQMLILRPIPRLISGNSEQETLQPNPEVSDFGAWFTGLLAFAPAAYSKIDEYLKQVMPDLKDIKNPLVGTDSRSLIVDFSTDQGTLTLPFADLSDGEKCFMICALVFAANLANGPILCFWDEPDNYLSLDEVGHFTTALRKAFERGGQFIATSHNPETIRRFSNENTLVLQRASHLEPTTVRQLSDLHIKGDLVGAIARGDI